MEIVKNCKGYPGYLVSKIGNVFSFRGKGTRELKQQADAKGYLSVKLYPDKKTVKVHKLVLEAFVSEKPEGMQANHIDEDKSNNYVDNLEWVTPSDNIRHSQSRSFYAFKEGKKIYNFITLKDAAAHLKVWPQNIHKVLTGDRNQTGGFTFKYIF